MFDAPWQARAFCLAVSLTEKRLYAWPAFRKRFAEEVARNEAETGPERVETAYYEQWLAAFERLVIEDGYLSLEELHPGRARSNGAIEPPKS